jgi:hypothetical protein
MYEVYSFLYHLLTGFFIVGVLFMFYDIYSNGDSAFDRGKREGYKYFLFQLSYPPAVALIVAGVLVKMVFEYGANVLLFYVALLVVLIGIWVWAIKVKEYWSDIVGLLRGEWAVWEEENRANIAALPDEYNPLSGSAELNSRLRLAKPLQDLIVTQYFHWLVANPYPSKKDLEEKFATTPPEERSKLLQTVPFASHAEAINKLMELVPAHGLVVASPTGGTFGDFMMPTLERASHDDDAHAYFIAVYTLGGFWPVLRGMGIKHILPDDLRTRHMHVLAGTGVGKTRLLYNMVLEDAKTDAAIVVIDSQRDTIKNLAERLDPDRVILIDPVACPPALNIFRTPVAGQQGIADALELYEYIFSSLDARLTSKQTLVYRYVSRLCMALPDASLATMRDMMQAGGTEEYLPVIQTLGDNAIAFFKEFERRGSQYSDTRSEVLRRLLTVLENETFSQMLTAKRMAIDVTAALDSGKIILVNTYGSLLKDASPLFGRIFVALVLQAVTARAEDKERRRTYLYIDEFGDYAEDSPILLKLFNQTRKYELGLIVFHQFLNQLPQQLAGAISANAAIKFASGLSSEDLLPRAKQMRVDPSELDRVPNGVFMASFKDIGSIRWPVDMNVLDRVPPHSHGVMQAIIKKMRTEYGIKDDDLPPQAPPPKAPDDAW